MDKSGHCQQWSIHELSHLWHLLNYGYLDTRLWLFKHLIQKVKLAATAYPIPTAIAIINLLYALSPRQDITDPVRSYDPLYLVYVYSTTELFRTPA